MPTLEELIEQLEAEKGIELCQLAADTLKRLNDALSETQSALKALVDKLRECEPHITSAFFMAYTNRGAVYSGPNYGKELAEADRVLSGAPK